MAEAFTWGSGGEKLSPADRRRRIADAMMKAGIDYSPVQHWTQGLNRVAQAMIGGYEARKADDEERAGQASVTGIMPEVLGRRAAATPAAPSMASGGEPRTMNMPADMKTGIADAAGALGISPVDLATVISYETGGTFDPTQAGPRTKWGQHRGLIQFGEPQAKQYGVDWSNPAASQLGANGAIVAYMRDRGVKPGMGLMDIYSTVNAGAPGLYDRSDAHAGGAPGTVADKVNNQMAGHRAKAQAMFRQAQADLPAPGASPVAMETGQPGFAVPPAPAADALPIMQEGGALPNFDPATGRWLGPSNPPALAAAPASQLEQQPAAEDPVQPLPPVFQSEGVSQPWMNTAIMPSPPEPQAAAMQSAPLPPSRPNDLAMPQADMPAPGAVPAIGMTTPQLPVRPEIDPNSPDGGMRAFQAAEAANAPGNGSIFDRIAAAMGGGAPQAAAPSSPGVARVAAATPAPMPATPAAASPGVERVAAAVPQQDGQLAAAMRVMNSPYAAPGQRAIAQAIVERSMRDPAEVEMKRLQLEKARREADTAPLDLEGRKLDIETKRKNLGKADAPTVQRIKQPDGSEVAVEWNQQKGAWVPLTAPEGGNAVRAPAKLTEQQSKDVGFYNRGSKIVDRLDSQDTALKDTLSALGGNVSNYLKSDAYRQAEQTGRELLAVILRKDTGAAVTDKEMELYGSIYLPKPGDDDATVAQKRASRRTAIEGLKMGLGPAEILFNSQNTPAPPPAAPPAAARADRSALEAEARRRGLIK